MTKSPIKNDLLLVIKEKYKKSYEIAVGIDKFLGEEFRKILFYTNS